MWPPRNILHPTDFSEQAQNALRLANLLARIHSPRLIVLHVAPPFRPAEMMPPGLHPKSYFVALRRKLRGLLSLDSTFGCSNFALNSGSKCSGRFRAGWLIVLALISHVPCFAQGGTDKTPDWFYPDWAATARFNTPVRVLDTDSALGRYSLQHKELGLKDLSRVHGHMCDGLVISFIEIKAALERLFPDAIADRTDLRAVSKNGSCWVDAVAMMTGARINFQTLRIDNAIGDGFIIQRISTGDAYEVRLKQGMFPVEQARLEARIRKLRKLGQPVSAADIDRVEVLANDLSRRLLNSSPADILEVKKLDRYEFRSNDAFDERGDSINKSSPRN